MNVLELDRVAIWTPKAVDEFTSRKTPAGRVAFKNKVAYRTEAPTYRYAKNYEKDEKKFCLFYVSYDADEEKAEAFLNGAAEKVNVSDYDFKDGFEFDYLDIYKED